MTAATVIDSVLFLSTYGEAVPRFYLWFIWYGVCTVYGVDTFVGLYCYSVVCFNRVLCSLTCLPEVRWVSILDNVLLYLFVSIM